MLWSTRPDCMWVLSSCQNHLDDRGTLWRVSSSPLNVCITHWFTLFRWIREWDIELEHKNHQIVLTLDNFTGHKILYQLKHITLVYFEPGLTSHIQPLDAGIICCFKVHYWHQFCVRAIQQDDAEENNIYKINLLDAMTMANEHGRSGSALMWSMVGI